tara:strand:+ start:1793 stop:2314 length:522 start_codon:yes stop_codon:yes gene_type:complete
MKILLKLIVFFVPTTFIVMFFILLTNDETYPGADYNSFELPPFRLDNLANSDLITKDTLEGNFILNVWASWCITCRIEHPYLMNLNNNGIPIIGLNYKDERDDAINWLNKYGNPYDLTVHDYKGTLALDLGVTGAPETFLVHNGKVVAHYQGEVNKLIWEDVFLPVIKEKEIF